MLWISELIMQNQPASFAELLELVKERARVGDRFLRMDVKPPYPDTPGNWEDQIEAAFTARIDP
ncbi:MAG: sulfur relay protein DsrC [Gammaproteobacteria bacterium]|nr:sulfur relay protein DsrC [Gammaproteobacteria bacterium]